jgi:hypothetical protein
MNKNEENNLNENEKNPFSLPEGYFDSFAQKMMRRIELAEELKEFPTLSSIDKKLPFVTPENYFVSNEGKTELVPFETLASLEKKNAFIIPELYFEHSSASIQNKIDCKEELMPYAALSAFEKENVFTVPQDYFESFNDKITAKLSQSGEHSVLRVVFNRKTAYAIAAMLVMSLGLFFYLSKQEETFADCQTLACLSKNEIKDHQFNNMDDESLMEIVNPEALSKNLEKGKSKEDKSSDKEQKEDYILENTDVNDIVDEI